MRFVFGVKGGGVVLEIVQVGVQTPCCSHGAGLIFGVWVMTGSRPLISLFNKHGVIRGCPGRRVSLMHKTVKGEDTQVHKGLRHEGM